MDADEANIAAVCGIFAGELWQFAPIQFIEEVVLRR